MLTGKPFVFAVGADLTEFPADDDARARARGGEDGARRLRGDPRRCPIPTLAAINGAALGGGLEIALHCDFRTLARSVRHIGFPEVFLGIIPGWGGTQLAPRLVGAAAAVELIVANPLKQNRMLRAGQAVELGLADELLDDVEFLDDSIEWLVRAIEEQRAPRAAADLSDAAGGLRQGALRRRRRRARRRARPVPRARADRRHGELDDRGGLRRRGGCARRSPARPAGAGRGVRVRPRRAADQEGRRHPRGEATADPEGRRRRSGADGDAARDAVPAPARGADRDHGRRRRRASRKPSLRFAPTSRSRSSRGRLGEGKARFLGSIVSGVADTSAFAGCDLVIEAVFEEIAVKREVFAALEAVVSEECLLVTNTSSLSVAEMAAELQHPERVVGMHFFNPVAVLPLVELVRAPATDDVTLATAWDVTKKLGKRGVLVKDAPAFVVNRLLTRQSSVLMQALENGNTFEETDAAALRLGLPMPPVGAPRDGRPAGREPRAPHAPRRVPRPLPALADARELRERRDGRRAHRRRPAHRGRDLRARSSRRSPTRRGTCSTRASSRRRARSTPA